MSNQPKADHKRNRRNYKWPLICVVFLFLVILVAGFLWLYKQGIFPLGIDDKNKSQSIGETKKAYYGLYADMLKKKQYSEYQSAMLTYYDSFINIKDIDGAKRVLDEILKNVPENKISFETYHGLSEYYKASGDKNQYIKYTKLLVTALKKAGMKEEAAYYEKQIKGQQ